MLYGDGGGLYLEVSRAGSKSWIVPVTVHRRRRDIDPFPQNTDPDDSEPSSACPILHAHSILAASQSGRGNSPSKWNFVSSNGNIVTDRQCGQIARKAKAEETTSIAAYLYGFHSILRYRHDVNQRCINYWARRFISFRHPGRYPQSQSETMGGRQSMVWRPQPIREALMKPGGSQKHKGPRRTRLSPCFYGGAKVYQEPI